MRTSIRSSLLGHTDPSEAPYNRAIKSVSVEVRGHGRVKLTQDFDPGHKDRCEAYVRVCSNEKGGLLLGESLRLAGWF